MGPEPLGSRLAELADCCRYFERPRHVVLADRELDLSLPPGSVAKQVPLGSVSAAR